MQAKLTIALATALAAIVCSETDALAAPCTDIANPIYLSFGETLVPVVTALAKDLAEAPQPINLVWRVAGSCTNLDSLYSNKPMVGNLSFVPAGFDISQPLPTCETPAAPVGVLPDASDSVVFVNACTALAKPADVAVFAGPVQPFAFVVAKASSQTAITSQEAYFTWGFGSAGQVTPWNDDNQLFKLPVTKGTIINLGAAIGVPPAKWKPPTATFPAQEVATLSGLATAVGTSTNPEKAIGILGSGVYEEYLNIIKPLAFRAPKQKFAYYPGSTSTSRDNKAVRDGHYNPWSYSNWLTKVDGTGKPLKGGVVSADLKYFIDLVTGQTVTPAPAFDVRAILVKNHLIPKCAMSVQRSSELGELSLYADPAPCGCDYEKHVGALSATCKACTDDTPCGGGKCRFGYCEAR